MTGGRFIVLEGGEGSGKSTQVARLGDRLRAAGHVVVQTFEPGATRRGVQLRSLLLGDDDPLDARAELLLMVADRAQHVRQVVKPALEQGAVVVSDRFSPSSLTYQGVGRGLGVDAAELLSRFAEGGITPDIVVVLDVSETTAIARRPDATDRMEREGADFHRRVRAAYRDLAAARGWVVVDGEGLAEEVTERVWKAIIDAGMLDGSGH